MEFIYCMRNLIHVTHWSPGILAWDYGNLMSSGVSLGRDFGRSRARPTPKLGVWGLGCKRCSTSLRSSSSWDVANVWNISVPFGGPVQSCVRLSLFQPSPNLLGPGQKLPGYKPALEASSTRPTRVSRLEDLQTQQI